MTTKEVGTFVTNLRNFTKRIHDLSIPVIAALDGVALGIFHLFFYLLNIAICCFFI